jgi:hypothetical protein
MPENRMLSNTMKGSKLRCMFYCIYKYYIYIIDWLMTRKLFALYNTTSISWHIPVLKKCGLFIR